MINRLNTRLGRDLGALPKPLFYEPDSARARDFPLQQAKEVLIALFGGAAGAMSRWCSGQTSSNQTALGPACEVEIRVRSAHRRHRHSWALSAPATSTNVGQRSTAEISSVSFRRNTGIASSTADPAAAVDGKIYHKWGGFWTADEFDPTSSDSTADARMIDPQGVSSGVGMGAIGTPDIRSD
jgi:hypothetical protein